MRKIVGIFVVMFLVFGLSGGFLYGQTAGQKSQQSQQVPVDEAMKKLAQDLEFTRALVVVIEDRIDIEALINKLEKPQEIEDPAVLEKIANDWLPVLKKYRQVLTEVILEIKKIFNQPNFIPNEKLRADLNKYYPEKIVQDTNRVLDEVHEYGIEF